MDPKILWPMIFGLIGGLGIFLLGIKKMSEDMQTVAGAGLRRMIGAVTNNRFLATGVGTLVTCLVQSRGGAHRSQLRRRTYAQFVH